MLLMIFSLAVAQSSLPPVMHMVSPQQLQNPSFRIFSLESSSRNTIIIEEVKILIYFDEFACVEEICSTDGILFHNSVSYNSMKILEIA